MLSSSSAAEKDSLTAGAKGVFQFDVKKGTNVESWTADLKSYDVYKGAAKGKPDVIMTMADEDLVALAAGKTTGYKHSVYLLHRLLMQRT